MIATVYPHLWKPSPERPESGLTRGGGLYEQGVVEHEDKGEAGLSVRVSWTKRQAAEFARRFQNAGGRGDG